MEREVLKYIQLHNMLSKGDGVTVGVSGGADSMCLLRMLMSFRERYELRLTVVHVNHGIRGGSADEDEAYVRKFCEEHNIAFVPVHADIPKIAGESGQSEEEAGRMVRYEAFRSVSRQYGNTKIAVAHNSEDNAETVILNIARGSALSGLKGIAPVRSDGEFTVIRPLLTVHRADIEAYLKKKGIEYRTDETNLEDEYSRNRIRHTILPALNGLVNSSAAEHICELSERAGEAQAFIEECATGELSRMEAAGQVRYVDENGRTGIVTDTRALLDLHPVIRKEIIRRHIGKLAGRLKDIESVHIDDIAALAERQVGRKINLPYGMRAFREYGTLVLERGTESKAASQTVAAEPIEIDLTTTAGQNRLAAKEGIRLLSGDKEALILHRIPYEKRINIPKNDYTKFFDYDKICGNVTLRSRLEGDFLLVRGQSGELHRKTLKTWFTDNKIPAGRRSEIRLLAQGSHVLWIVGYRADDSCLVDETTRYILRADIVAEVDTDEQH